LLEEGFVWFAPDVPETNGINVLRLTEPENFTALRRASTPPVPRVGEA
jgi:hypothetical protein